MTSQIRWGTWLVVAVGAGLRIALGCVLPPARAYDDHFKPVQVILEQHILPSAADCWECFQPPLYYVFSAGVYEAGRQLALSAGAAPEAAIAAGRKAMQFISVVAGIATLPLCVPILRRVLRPSSGLEAFTLAFVAVLPRHVYMSAMVTNDAFAVFIASLAVYVALRAAAGGWTLRGCLAAGGVAGLGVLSKGYGWMTVVSVAGALAWVRLVPPHASAGRAFRIGSALRLLREAWHAAGPARDVTLRRLRPVALVLVAALALGIVPTVRNVWIYRALHVDNYDIYDTPMYFQLPRTVGNTEFLTFRLPALLREPYIHISHVNSFPTELYARFWFDYEGFSTTLTGYPPWEEHFERCLAATPDWDKRRCDLLLSYPPAAVPPTLRRIAVVSYLAGLPLTAWVLLGLVRAIRRPGAGFAGVLVPLHFLAGLSVPLFQLLRLPHFAAMKAAFALSGITSVPILLAFAFRPAGATRDSRLRFAVRLACVAVLWLSLWTMAVMDVAYIAALSVQVAHFPSP